MGVYDLIQNSLKYQTGGTGYGRIIKVVDDKIFNANGASINVYKFKGVSSELIVKRDSVVINSLAGPDISSVMADNNGKLIRANYYQGWINNSTGIYYSGSAVGIGTRFPNYKLDIQGPSANLRLKSSTYFAQLVLDAADGNAEIQLKNNNSLTWTLKNDPLYNDLKLIYNTTNNPTYLTISSFNGNIGIGETNPSAKLSIKGNIQINDGNQAVGKVLTSDYYGNGSWQAITPQVWNSIASGIYYSSNVGIGTSALGFPLNFANTSGDKISFYGSSGAHYGVGIQGGLLQIHADIASSDIAFGTGSSNSFSEKMRIKGNGNVGIGTNSPTAPLSFATTLGEKILFYQGASGTVGMGVYGNELRIHADHNLAKVSFGSQDNTGIFTEYGKFEKNGAYALSVLGSIWANGTTYNSDIRFKKSITPIENALKTILDLKGVNYYWKKETFPKKNFSEKLQFGLIAQEVEKIIPEIINSDEEGYKSIDYNALVPILIEAIKDQQAQINELKREIRLHNSQSNK